MTRSLSVLLQLTPTCLIRRPRIRDVVQKRRGDRVGKEITYVEDTERDENGPGTSSSLDE